MPLGGWNVWHNASPLIPGSICHRTPLSRSPGFWILPPLRGFTTQLSDSCVNPAHAGSIPLQNGALAPDLAVLPRAPATPLGRDQTGQDLTVQRGVLAV